MARENTNGAAVIRCDMPGCKHRFVTYSVAAKAREQAANEGWERRSGKRLHDAEGYKLSDKRVDLCPEHKPKPRVMG